MKKNFLVLTIILICLSACNNNEIIVNEADSEVVMETIVNDNGVSIARLNQILDSAKKMTKRTTDDVQVAVFGLDKQPYKDSIGKDTLIDTLWIFYKDGSFEQYANIGDEIVLFSTGNFNTKIRNDYIFNAGDTITINRDNKYKVNLGLDESHKSSHDYELEKLEKLGFIKVNISLD